MYGMIVDTVDFAEYHKGIKAAGMLSVTAAQVSNMVGGIFGAYVPLEMMDAAARAAGMPQGFDPNIVVQPAQVLHAISFAFNYLPCIFYAATIVVMIFYGKFIESKQEGIRKELAERRAKVKIVNLAAQEKAQVAAI